MRLKTRALAAALLALANPWLWAAPQGGAQNKKVIVTFKSGTSSAAREKALQGLGAKPTASIMSNGNSSEEFVAVVAEVPAAGPTRLLSAAPVSLAPQQSEEVLSIEEDYRVKWIEAAPASFSAAPLPGGSLKELGIDKFQSSGSNARILASGVRPAIPWGVKRVGAPRAWENNVEGKDVNVAVIDTGIDADHPALSAKVDGGFNAITDSEEPASFLDDNGHGTHVAGTIAANGKRLKGVAPLARLYAVKVLDSDGSGSLSDVIKGIIWCANHDIQVANMSLGSSLPSETMHRALRYAKARGVVVVAAAGNSGPDGGVGYPAAYPETIAVSASDSQDRIASFSSRGPEVKFIAPGVDILSAKKGGDYILMSGTSMATPHVTGLAALAVSEGWRGLSGPDGVLNQLQKAAKPLQGLEPTEEGYGMINAGLLTRVDP